MVNVLCVCGISVWCKYVIFDMCEVCICMCVCVCGICGVHILMVGYVLCVGYMLWFVVYKQIVCLVYYCCVSCKGRLCGVCVVCAWCKGSHSGVCVCVCVCNMFV